MVINVIAMIIAAVSIAFSLVQRKIMHDDLDMLNQLLLKTGARESMMEIALEKKEIYIKPDCLK